MAGRVRTRLAEKKGEKMIKNFGVKSLVLVIAFSFLAGCSLFEKQVKPIPTFSAEQYNSDMYSSKVDNFLIIFDASSSMDEEYYGISKFKIAQELVLRLNETVPELGQVAGVRSFGHDPGVSKKNTQLFYGMEKYNSDNLKDNFGKISRPGGTSPLNKAFGAAGTDLKDLSGETAVIIISDGLDLPGDPLASAKVLNAAYGSSICFYPILVGDAPESVVAGAKELAKIGECGFDSTAGELLTSAGMAAFVEKVFVAEKPAPVVEPAPVVKAAPVVITEKDSDNDGVYDKSDQCPDTPEGASVNTVGCWAFSNTALFDFDKSDIKSAAYPMLNEAVTVLEKNPSMNITLQGHTDNVGSSEYNMGLSLDRANAVKDYFVGKGIAADRLATEGFGFTRPVSLNDSESGRSLNRRVEIQP